MAARRRRQVQHVQGHQRGQAHDEVTPLAVSQARDIDGRHFPFRLLVLVFEAEHTRVAEMLVEEVVDRFRRGAMATRL